MEKLKALFGTEALTYEQLETKLKDNKEIKLVNLAEGGYVDKSKFDAKLAQKGCFGGESAADLNLPYSMLRAFVVLDRTGMFDK